jgi:hypothetical protein
MNDLILIYFVPFAWTNGGSITVFWISIFIIGSIENLLSSIRSDSSTSRGKIISITHPIGKVFYAVN